MKRFTISVRIIKHKIASYLNLKNWAEAESCKARLDLQLLGVGGGTEIDKYFLIESDLYMTA